MIDKENKSNTLFLLGGHDLEMIEIKALLEKEAFKNITQNKDFGQPKCYADLELGWGASTENYSRFYFFTGIIYGVELTEPIGWIKPPNYHAIDHHNEQEKEKSSIEQVAELLKIKLDRYQQLVARNDRGYIPAMIDFGATQKEIDEIRFADRKAQGVEDYDERLAEQSIRKNLKVVNDITIIHSLTDKFSPITDRRFGMDEHLIVHTHNSLCYYGGSKTLIANYFEHLVREKRAYSGGGSNGFFGIADNTFSSSEIENLTIKITQIIKNG